MVIKPEMSEMPVPWFFVISWQIDRSLALTPRLSLEAYGSVVVLTGGLNGVNNTTSNDTLCFLPSTKKWFNYLPAMPKSCNSLDVAVCGGLLHVVSWEKSSGRYSPTKWYV